MKIAYLVGLIGVLGLIFSNLGMVNIVAQSITVVLLIMMGGMMYGLLFGSYIFVGSKQKNFH